MKFIALTALCCLMLAGCAGKPMQQAIAPIQIASGISLQLPRPAELGRNIEADQLVVAHYGAQSFSFEGRIKIANGVFTMIALDPLGRRLASITWNADGIKADTSYSTLNHLDPANILADLALIYWPEDVMRHAVIGGTLNGSDDARSVSRDHREIIRVTFAPAHGDPWQATVHYVNEAYGYSLEIRSTAL